VQNPEYLRKPHKAEPPESARAVACLWAKGQVRSSRSYRAVTQEPGLDGWRHRHAEPFKGDWGVRRIDHSG
jgi:hypothetical protein